MRFKLILTLLVFSLLSGCADLSNPGQPTIIPAEYLPTAIALTLQARGADQTRRAPATLTAAAPPASPTARPRRTSTPSRPAATSIPEETSTPIPDTLTPTVNPTLLTPFVGAGTPTFAPPIPDAIVQIYRLGELSLVTSPLQITTRLTSEWGKVIRIELFGEDGRLLARYLRTFVNVPWDAARVDVDLEFEISAAGEAGRLVISVEDLQGRLIDVNSVNLILLSSGVTQLNPATALQQRLIIEEPTRKALIQGGSLIISGRALANRPDQPLRVMLIGEDGKILGQRLARIKETQPGAYGTFVAAVPYSVTGLTSARLVIYEEGEPVSDIAHLSSVEVILTP